MILAVLRLKILNLISHLPAREQDGILAALAELEHVLQRQAEEIAWLKTHHVQHDDGHDE